ncbi:MULTISPECIES: hypothetical protein [Nostocales]|uniref:Uncharacterized protein n=3 Tax=Nostocales TaxID=1161 RepID=A0A0C1N5W9_9CYAN|nr:hypothetical protein [Tolypothrix bouteillei]KAF3885932.1 hypothetical protein DA73_0400010970 [Tolypothrix bouteillei VB521301]
MDRRKWFFHKLLNTQFLTTGILTAMLLLTQVVAEYRPPGNQKPPRTNTDSSGTRFFEQFPNVLSYTLNAPIL